MALYLGSSLYRIHGTNDAKSIGRAASSGCFRMHNGHIVDLSDRVDIGVTVQVVNRLPPELDKLVADQVRPPKEAATPKKRASNSRSNPASGPRFYYFRVHYAKSAGLSTISLHSPFTSQSEAKAFDDYGSRSSLASQACEEGQRELECSMAPFTQRSFKAAGVRSLCWRGDELVDWVGGGRAFALSGIERESSVHYAYRFDAATASPDGRFVAIYERLGTKGLLLHDGKLLRELDRSHYFADAYEYPVALFHEPGGRLLLAHCPRRYNCIELDEVVTGDSLTASAERSPSDFFHSRLAASPSGKRLLSAGWVWHPLGVVEHFDIARALEDPHHLDCGDPLPHSAGGCLAEVSSACWLGDDHVAVASSGESDDRPNSHEDGQPGLRPRGLAVYDLANHTCIRAFRLDEPPGTILTIGTRHVLPSTVIRSLLTSQPAK
jgi:hypothetical protein